MSQTFSQFNVPQTISWIIIGIVAGSMAGRLVWREQQFNWLRSVIIGVVGAIIGGFIFNLLGSVGFRVPQALEDIKFGLVDVIVAFIGAVILLFIVKFLTHQQQQQQK